MVLVSESDKSKVQDKFPAADIITVPGVDAQVLSRILGKNRASEFKIEPLLPGQQAVTSSYWWGTDAAVYYTYNNMDPLYFWKVAGLVRTWMGGVWWMERGMRSRQLLCSLLWSDSRGRGVRGTGQEWRRSSDT